MNMKCKPQAEWSRLGYIWVYQIKKKCLKMVSLVCLNEVKANNFLRHVVDKQ